MIAIARWIGAYGRALFGAAIGSYGLGVTALIVAPAIVAIAAVPEFTQHVAEISLGMFGSRAAAHAVAASPLRLGIGYVKIAGLVATMLLIARFWAMERDLRRTLLIPPRVALGVALGVGAFILVGAASDRAPIAWPIAARGAILIAVTLVQAGIAVWTIGTLVEDCDNDWRDAFTRRLPVAIALLLLFLIAMLPATALHALDHRLALGQPLAIIWLVMSFDALLVGAMAAVAGSALHLGYRLDRSPTKADTSI